MGFEGWSIYFISFRMYPSFVLHQVNSLFYPASFISCLCHRVETLHHQCHSTSNSRYPLFLRSPSILAVIMGESGVRQNSSAAAVIENDRRRSKVNDHAVTGAGEITLRQSILPVSLVTILFFMWGFAYGLLDVLNAHFQSALNISQGMSGGLQAAYVSYILYPNAYQKLIVTVRSILYRSSNIFRLACTQIRLQVDIHCWSLHLRRRRSE